jgi:hypothetical protein
MVVRAYLMQLRRTIPRQHSANETIELAPASIFPQASVYGAGSSGCDSVL